MAKAFIHIALFRQLKLTAMDMTCKALNLNSATAGFYCRCASANGTLGCETRALAKTLIWLKPLCFALFHQLKMTAMDMTCMVLRPNRLLIHVFIAVLQPTEFKLQTGALAA